MKETTLKITKQDDSEIIAKTLYDILSKYDPKNGSNDNYIKINISGIEDLAIIIKMLNLFNNGLSCILTVCVVNETCCNNDDNIDKIIHAGSIQYDFQDTVIKELLCIGIDVISKSVLHLINSININECSIRIIHNFDEENPRKSFIEIMRVKYIDNDDKTLDDISKMFGHIMINLNKNNDCMIIKLYFNINIGDPEEISTIFTCKIQFSEIFGNPIYNFSVDFPDQQQKNYYGYTEEEAEDFLLTQLDAFSKLLKCACKENETGLLILYGQRKETRNVY